MKQFYRADELNRQDLEFNGKPARLGVIGNPIAHSKSPQMQQAALDALDKPCSYIRLEADLAEGGFAHMLQRLDELDFIGANVTVPFKRLAFAQADHSDALSQLCGASNSLARRGDGWHAYNTDGPGFERAIAELSGRSLSEMKIVILGACGGAGSALASQCALAATTKLCLVNRPKPALDELAAKLEQHSTGQIHTAIFGTEELKNAVAEADLIVNATSLGLKESDPLPLPPEWLEKGQFVYDIVTHPTPWIRAAAERGCKTDTGLAMLLWQGALAFRHWFGVTPDIALMRHALQQA